MKPKNAFMLILTAFIWGTAFVAQSVGMDYVQPFTFNGVRSLIGAVALLPCILLLGKRQSVGETVAAKGATDQNGVADQKGAADQECVAETSVGDSNKTLIIGGILCGICLFVASSLQQTGIQYTSAGKAGFITALYIIFVPVLGIFFHKKVGWKIWLAVVLALMGLYFLCIKEGFSIGRGDIYVFACALVFSIHILVIDYFSPKVDGVKLSCIQFLVCGLLSFPCMFLWESPDIHAILLAKIPILYAGVLSCAVGYTFQIIGQTGMNPTIASLLMSLESTFSVLAGWVILQETLSAREAFGCVLMFVAIILAQLPDKKKKEIEV